MGQIIRPALFKSISLLNKDDISRELNIPQFDLNYEYDFWEILPDAYIYDNESTGAFLIELAITEYTLGIINETFKELSMEKVEQYKELFESIRYCQQNDIEWLQLMVI